MVKNSNKKILYLSVFLLLINFIYRLLNQSKMLKYFPVDYNIDGASYMAQLYFLKNCGFHKICYYWYNGFINFLHSPPGWYLFTLPIFETFKSVNVATYLSMLLIFLLLFIIIYFLFGSIGLSRFKRIALFIFFFGNAIAVGNFIKLIRVHELFAWMNFFLFFFLIYYFKDRKIDWRYWLVVPFYAIILLSYQSVGVITSLLFLSIFLVKNGKEKLIVCISALLSLLVSAFWWLPAILKINEGGLNTLHQATWVWRFDTLNFYTNIFVTIIPLIFFIVFYYYIKNLKSKSKELLFYSPILFLALIFFLRLHPFIPIFNNIFPDPYLIFFIFFIIFCFLKIDISLIRFSNYVSYILLFIVLLSLSFNLFRTPLFVVPDQPLNLQIEETLKNVEGSFLMFGYFGSKINPKNVYSYAPTKYNLTTAYGWYPEVKNEVYFKGIQLLDGYFNDNNCKGFLSVLHTYNVSNIISLNENCDFFNRCKLKEKVKKDSVCLYDVN